MSRTVVFGLKQAVIALNNLNGTWGTPIRVKGVVSASVTNRTESGEQMGDDGVYSVIGKSLAATVQLTFADLQGFDVISVMTGNVVTTTSSNTKHMGMSAGDYYPYFSMCAQATMDDGIQLFNLWIPKMKITSDFNYDMQNGSFIVPAFSCTAIGDEFVTRRSRPVIVLPFEYSVNNIALTIPPTNVPLVVA